MNGLSANGLAKTYRKTGAVALRSLSLAVRAGEMVALLGPNGAGKSTFVKIVCGLVLPDAGTVTIAGHDLSRDRKRALASLAVCLEGDRNLYQRLTVRENVVYFLALLGERSDQGRIRAMAERLHVDAFLDSQVRFLSKGTKQKVSLLVTLLCRAPVVLLDEPTVGVDVQVKHELSTILRELPRQGRAVLLTTHELDVAEQLADRVVILREGCLVTDASPTTIRELHARVGYSLLVAGYPEGTSFPGTRVVAENGHQRVLVEGDLDAALGMARTLAAQGVTIFACERHLPSLEEVYLSLMERPS